MRNQVQIIGSRAIGKSTALLRLALYEGANIAVPNRSSLEAYIDIASSILQIPYEEIVKDPLYVKVKNVLIAPIWVYLMRPHHPQYNRSKPLYVDELLVCLEAELGRNIDGYSLTTSDARWEEPIFPDCRYEEEV